MRTIDKGKARRYLGGMTSDELKEAMEALGLGPADLARLVNRYAGTSLIGRDITRMTMSGEHSRAPSATVRAVVSMTLEQEQAAAARVDELAAALRVAGLRLVRTRRD